MGQNGQVVGCNLNFLWVFFSSRPLCCAMNFATKANDSATRARVAPTSVGSPQAATVRHDGSDDGRCVERGARQDAVVAQDVRGINAGFVAKRQDPLACEDPGRGQDPGAVRPREDPGG